VRYILVLLSWVYGGEAPAVVQNVVYTKDECEAAGKAWDAVKTINGYEGKSHVCIPAPNK
jgi:hypothetical protein